MITHEYVVVLGFKLMLFSTVSESTKAKKKIWPKLALQSPLVSRRAVCFLGWSCFTCAVPLTLSKSHFFFSPKHLLQIPKLLPDVQNSQMIHWSSPLCRYWLQGRGKRGKKREKRKTWRPKVSSQKSHLFCWLNSCRMSCGSSCLIVIRASVRLWAHSISPY